MLAKLRTFSLLGIDALPVEVEVDVSPSALPKTVLVGLPEAAVKESTHRVERALVNSGFQRPQDRVVINLLANALTHGEGVAQVARAASKDEARPVLTGILVEVNREGVTMVATDSYRLAVREVPATGEGEATALVPERAMSEVGRAALGEEKGEVEIVIGAESWTVPAGSFVRNEENDGYQFLGTISSLKQVVIRDDGGFRVRASELSLPSADAANPLSFFLRIGNDEGNVQVASAERGRR